MKIADLFVKLGLKNDEFKKGIDQSKKQVSKFTQNLKKVGGLIAGYFAFDVIKNAIGGIIKRNIEFEKSLSTLKSLTGVTSEELKFYSTEAKRMGSTTTQTASQVAKAFTLIGSKKPELLANKEALVAITEQAIILAEAASIDVPQAANALANSLNQMSKGADAAGRFINILAAGSKSGAGDISFLNAAIEKSGGTAEAVGLSFEELVGAIETIAPKVTEPTTAGLQFRQVLLKLASGVDKFNPKVVGLGKALHNLQGEQLSINELTEKFGVINVVAAKALIDGADSFDKYTASVTGTNTALEQQAINVDNVDGQIKQLESAWEGLGLSMSKTNGFMSVFIKSATGLLFLLQGTSFKKTGFESLSDAIAEEVGKGANELELFNAAAKNMADEVNVQVEKIRSNFGEGILSKANDKEFLEFATGPVKQALLTLNKLRLESSQVNDKIQKLETEELKKSLAERFNLENKNVQDLENLRKSFASMTGDRKKEADLILPLIEKEITARLTASAQEVQSYKSIEAAIKDLSAQKESMSKLDVDGIAVINDKIKALQAEKKALDDLTNATIDRSATATGITPEGAKGSFTEKFPKKITAKGTLGEDIIADQKAKQEQLLADQMAFNQQAASLAADFVTDTVVVFADGIGQMLSGDLDIAGFGKALLSAVGGFLSSLGKMMIQFGATALVYSILAKALANPVTAGPAALGMIAAGAALVAIGGAISGAAGNGGGGGGGGAITTIDTRGGRTQSTSGSLENTVAQPVTVMVEGEIRNSVIALSSNKGQKDLNR